MSTKNKLTNEDAPTAVVKDVAYYGMYRLKWADGVLSADMYNLSRAHDMLSNYAEYRQYMKQRDPRFNNLIAFHRAEKL